MQYRQAVERGRTALRTDRLADAVALFDAALRLRPDAAEAYYGRGEALFLLRRIDEALASHAAALAHGIERDPGCRSAAMSGRIPGDFGWMSHMLRGDFASAWRLADRERAARLAAGVATGHWPRHLRPVWDGRPLDGRRVLLRCWHGLGDTIQFIRYAPLIAQRCARLRVEAPPELLPPLRGVAGIDRLLPLAADTECRLDDVGCDAEIDVAELPHALRTTLQTIPAAVPYLNTDQMMAEAAGRSLARLPPGRRVGLAWAAGSWKPERSIPLAALAPLAVEGAAFINLQGGPEYRQWRIASADRPLAMADCGTADDIAAAAAVIARLDLVITVDTMIAHLAGALGAPVWLMLHFAADWRWLLDRRDSPWYPTMRLFRQRHPGEWTPVIAEVAAALREFCADRETS